jgi:hypothetical protein
MRLELRREAGGAAPQAPRQPLLGSREINSVTLEGAYSN